MHRIVSPRRYREFLFFVEGVGKIFKVVVGYAVGELLVIARTIYNDFAYSAHGAVGHLNYYPAGNRAVITASARRSYKVVAIVQYSVNSLYLVAVEFGCKLGFVIICIIFVVDGFRFNVFAVNLAYNSVELFLRAYFEQAVADC